MANETTAKAAKAGGNEEQKFHPAFGSLARRNECMQISWTSFSGGAFFIFSRGAFVRDNGSLSHSLGNGFW